MSAVRSRSTRASTFRDRSFPALNAVRAAGAIMVVLTHSAFNTGRINDGWVGAMLARAEIRAVLDELLLRCDDIRLGQAEVSYPNLTTNMSIYDEMPITLTAR